MLVFDTDGDSFTNILAMCDCKPWNFDIGGEKEGDANNPNAVKICFKQNLTEAESEYEFLVFWAQSQFRLSPFRSPIKFNVIKFSQ